MSDIFDSFIRGKVSSATDEPKCFYGIPYVGATDKNNGVLDFLEPNVKKVQLGNCITFIRDGQGSVGSSVYRTTPFIATVNTSSGYAKWLNECNGIFVSTASNQVRTKYSFGYKRKEERLISERIMLPMTNSGEPDYDYMTEFIWQKRKALLTKYRACIEKRISELGELVQISDLKGKEWKPIAIKSIFERLIPGKGKGLNHLTKVNDLGINYIGATNRNNGVLCYVKDDDIAKHMILQGNCIGFIKNGDGSAGYAIYKAESFISTSDIIYGYASWLNKFTGLFFVAAQDMIEQKYSHGYKRNKQHLEADKVMLPINNDGAPDFDYMEQYVKNLMLKKYQQYLAFLETREKY